MNAKAEQILNEATKLFLSRGYRNTSMQSIADACGIAKGSVYRYFKNKESLVIALIERIDDELMNKLAELASDKTLSARKRFSEQIRVQIDLNNEHKQIHELLMEDFGDFTPDFFDFVSRMRLRWQEMQQQTLLSYFGETIAAWRGDLSIMMSGMINEYASYLLLEDIKLPINDVVGMIVYSIERIVEGLEEHKPIPALKSDMLPDSAHLDQLMVHRRHDRLVKAIDELSSLASSLTLNNTSVVQATIQLLSEHVLSEKPDKIIIRALLASLRDHKSFDHHRAKIAQELDVELV